MEGRVTHQQIIDTLANSIKRNPQWINMLPESYKNELMSSGSNINTVVIEEKKNHTIRDVGYFKTLSRVFR